MRRWGLQPGSALATPTQRWPLHPSACAGQQWDHPNVWPPVDWMVIDGLETYGGTAGQDLARMVWEQL